MKDRTVEKNFETIKQTGCPEIQSAISGRKESDFSPDMVEWMAEFVRTSPSDTQAAPRTEGKRGR